MHQCRNNRNVRLSHLLKRYWHANLFIIYDSSWAELSHFPTLCRRRPTNQQAALGAAFWAVWFKHWPLLPYISTWLVQSDVTTCKIFNSIITYLLCCTFDWRKYWRLETGSVIPLCCSSLPAYTSQPNTHITYSAVDAKYTDALERQEL